MLLWFTDLMNVTEEVTIDRPNISTFLSSAFIRGGLKFLFCVCVCKCKWYPSYYVCIIT